MQEAKKIYIIAGEPSGDLHGSNLMKELYHLNPNLNIRYWGGDLMKNTGGTLVKHVKELAFMGFVEVLLNLRTILKNIDFCKNDITTFKPDVIVMIDYPGFNLRIAEWAKTQGIKVVYYISPQIWAWKQKRVHKIKACVDEMFTILPFEKDFYAKFDYPVHYVGHPLLDAVENYYKTATYLQFKERNNLKEKPIIAILPGSRKQEVNVKLPIMINAIKGLDQYQFIIAGAPSLEPAFYAPFLNDNVKIVYNQTYDLLANSEAGIVTSGTATLETALFNVPEVVCYKGSEISYRIAKRLIKIKYISLVNLILDREVVKELIQHECTAQNIRKELEQLIIGGNKREEMLNDYKLLKEILGNSGASKKVAIGVLKTIQ